MNEVTGTPSNLYVEYNVLTFIILGKSIKHI